MNKTNSMTRQAALCKLAEGVMGRKVIGEHTFHRHSDARTRTRVFDCAKVAVRVREKLYFPTEDGFLPPALDGRDWNPWKEENVRQAVELAEAWRAKGNTRWWRLYSPQAGAACKKFTAHLSASIKDLARGCCHSDGDTPSAAFTGAVCEAEGIKVEEA